MPVGQHRQRVGQLVARERPGAVVDRRREHHVAGHVREEGALGHEGQLRRQERQSGAGALGERVDQAGQRVLLVQERGRERAPEQLLQALDDVDGDQRVEAERREPRVRSISWRHPDGGADRARAPPPRSAPRSARPPVLLARARESPGRGRGCNRGRRIAQRIDQHARALVQARDRHAVSRQQVEERRRHAAPRQRWQRDASHAPARRGRRA